MLLCKRHGALFSMSLALHEFLLLFVSKHVVVMKAYVDNILLTKKVLQFITKNIHQSNH